ncbi:MAG: hypothetical protein ABEJ04_00050 [Halobacteriaceae archaeon]
MRFRLGHVATAALVVVLVLFLAEDAYIFLVRGVVPGAEFLLLAAAAFALVAFLVRDVYERRQPPWR